MKTKKITALVLAALMAAGTTATAFADCDVVNAGGDKDAKRPLTFNDETIYENEDGVLTPSTDFRPGDTLYIRLDELNANGDKKIEDEKDDMNVYADWKVGKDAVESIDIVYKKGYYQDGDNYATEGYTYTFNGGALNGLSVYVAGGLLNQSELNEKLKDNAEFKKLVDGVYLKNTGYTFGTDDYAADADALTAGLVAAGKYTDSQTYYAVNDKQFKSTDTATDALTGAGFRTVTEDVSSTEKLWVDAANNAYEITENNPGSYTDESANKANYYIKPDAEGGKSGKIVDITSITDMSDLDALESVTGIKKVENAYLNNTTDVFYDDVAAVVADALNTQNAAAVPADGVYVEGAKVLANQEAAIAKALAGVSSVSHVAKDVAANNYTYWVEIKTKEDDTTKVLDLAGVLRIGSTKNKAEDVTNAFQLDTSLDNRVYDSGAYVTVEDEWTFAPDSRSVVKFSDDAEDVVLYFGENEAAWFEFDARGQSALNLEFTFDFNKEIADLFPEANIDFLTFTSKPATNRTGDLYIVADEDTYLYEVTDDGVKEIPNAEYDEKEGAWHIRTRKLGAYAISDTELDTSRTLDGDESSSESGNSGNNNGTKPIPDTGR